MDTKRSFKVWLAGGFLRLLGRLPLGWHRFWARVLAWLLQRVLRYRTQIVSTNLARSFPEKSYEALEDIQNRFYRHFAATFTEMIWFGACRGPKGRERLHRSHIVEFTNPEELNRLVAAAPQLMLLEAHTGNWELIGGINLYSYTEPMDITPQTVTVAYHGIYDKVWAQVMADGRTAPVRDQDFQGYVHTDSILRYALSHRHDKRCYIMITDQYPYMHNGSLTVEFMHQRTRSMDGAAALACKLGMSCGYLRYRCREDGGYTLTVIPLADNASETTPEALMKRYYQLLEEDLHAQPWNYLWSHKRWKV